MDLSLLTPRTLLRKAREYTRKLWVRVAIMGLMAVVAVGVAPLIEHFVPEKLARTLGGQAADRLLQIIANAMLAVTTFSLTVMVSIHRSVSGQWTPRAHRMLLRDTPTQTVLATFMGAYIYALTSLILLYTPYFGEAEVVVLFGMTLVVIVLIVAMMMRWILHLETWGSLIQTTSAIEEAAITSLDERARAPCYGANVLTPDTIIPATAVDLHALRTGFVQSVYQARINAKAAKAGAIVYLTVPTGSFVQEGDVIGHVASGTPELIGEIMSSLTIGNVRTPDQDPRFCLIMLSEIASKALSPGINDPGTAIDILGRMTRVLGHLAPEEPRDNAPLANLWLPPLDIAELVTESFAPIARDGAGTVEVQIALQKRLAGLQRHAPAPVAAAARRAAADALARARVALLHPSDRDRLAEAVKEPLPGI